MMATAGHKEEVPQRSIELAVTVLVTILNIVEIIVISTLNHQLKTFELLLLSLSASDLLFGLSNGILCVIYLTDHTKYELFEITYTTTFYFVLTSILTLSWIALDRLWAVCWPFSHSYYITRGRTRIIIIATWIFTTATGVSLFVYHELSESEDVKIDSNFTTAATTTATSTKSSTNTYKADIQLALSIFILLADVVFCFSYGYIIYNVKQTNQSITAVKDNVFQKVSTVCILIATVFITFTLPYAFSRLITGKVPPWANMVLMVNSAMNSAIYCFREKFMKFCKRIKRTLGKSIEMKTIQTDETTISTVPVTQVIINKSVQ